jgi:hypothetical protein
VIESDAEYYKVWVGRMRMLMNRYSKITNGEKKKFHLMEKNVRIFCNQELYI